MITKEGLKLMSEVQEQMKKQLKEKMKKIFDRQGTEYTEEELDELVEEVYGKGTLTIKGEKGE